MYVHKADYGRPYRLFFPTSDTIFWVSVLLVLNEATVLRAYYYA